MTTHHSYCVVAATNDAAVLGANLERSPEIADGSVPLHPMSGYASAGAAYNDGLDRSEADIVVFAHQDVYLPAAWIGKVDAAIARLERDDPDWAVCGVVGITGAGAKVGRVWSSGLNAEIGWDVPLPAPVVSVDEMIIILNRASGLRFDAGLPGFHLYGTDIVAAARERGLGAYVIDAPAVHNSVPVTSLAGAYARAYRYVRAKWKAYLPIQTLVAKVTRSGYPLYRAQLRSLAARLRGRPPRDSGQDRPDAAEIARRLGYEG